MNSGDEGLKSNSGRSGWMWSGNSKDPQAPDVMKTEWMGGDLQRSDTEISADSSGERNSFKV